MSRERDLNSGKLLLSYAYSKPRNCCPLENQPAFRHRVHGLVELSSDKPLTPS